MSYLKHTSLKVKSNNSIPKVWSGNMYNDFRNKHLADERGNRKPCV